MILHKQQKQQQRQHINKSRQIGRQAVRQTDRNKQAEAKTKQFTVSVFIIAGITNTVW